MVGQSILESASWSQIPALLWLTVSKPHFFSEPRFPYLYDGVAGPRPK